MLHWSWTVFKVKFELCGAAKLMDMSAMFLLTSSFLEGDKWIISYFAKTEMSASWLKQNRKFVFSLSFVVCSPSILDLMHSYIIGCRNYCCCTHGQRVPSWGAKCIYSVYKLEPTLCKRLFSCFIWSDLSSRIVCCLPVICQVAYCQMCDWFFATMHAWVGVWWMHLGNNSESVKTE